MLVFIAGALVLYAAIATGIAVGIGRAITTADHAQAEQAPTLRLVS